MEELLYSVGGFLVAIGLLVTIHEFGHFSVARLYGVKVLRFSFGFGRPIWIRRLGPDSTEYAIGLIPLGGYVRMLDERESPVSLAERHRAFNRQKLMVRVAIVVAGPLANFFLAVLLYWIALIIGISGFSPVIGQVLPGSIGEQLGFLSGDQIISIDDRPMMNWSDHHLYLVNQTMKGRKISFELRAASGSARNIEVDPGMLSAADLNQAVLEGRLGLIPLLPPIPPIVGEVLIGSPAADGGLRENDVITEINGIPISDWRELVQQISRRPGELLELVVRRANGQITIYLTPERVIHDSMPIGRIGIKRIGIDELLTPASVLRLDPIVALSRAISNTWLLSELTVRAIGSMLTLKMSTENLGGPVTIAYVAGQSAKVGVVPFLIFLAVISVSLGVLNLLPIPVLDGGHLLYLFIEAIKGTPVSPETMQFGQRLGIVVLTILMCIALYNDMVKVVS